jgi:hypothetical protein
MKNQDKDNRNDPILQYLGLIYLSGGILNP